MSHHHHVPAAGWVLRLSLVATLAFTALEIYAGLRSHSLALLSDAGHNFTDAFALLLAAIGLYFQGRPADQTRTWGYHRAGVLAAFLNAVTLIAISVFIVWEAIQRLVRPEAVNDAIMLWISLLALALNGGIMLALRHSQKNDLNLRAAFIHMLGDALGAVAILAGALVIHYTNWLPIDPLLSIALAALIVITAWGITRESLNILLEGLPRGLTLGEVTSAMSKVDGVLDVHDLHIWCIGSQTRALSSHVLIDDMPHSSSDAILKRINDTLCGFGIYHTTIQFEHVPCVVSGEGCRMEQREQPHSHAADHGHHHHPH